VVFDREHYHISFAKFRVVFQTAEPFLYDEFPDGIELVDIDDSFSEEFQNLGTAPTLPKFIFVFKAGTTVSEVEIETTETVLTITTALTQDDVLIVDSEEKTVTLNGSEIDYT
jgi:phage-related protein